MCMSLSHAHVHVHVHVQVHVYGTFARAFLSASSARYMSVQLSEQLARFT